MQVQKIATGEEDNVGDSIYARAVKMWLFVPDEGGTIAHRSRVPHGHHCDRQDEMVQMSEFRIACEKLREMRYGVWAESAEDADHVGLSARRKQEEFIASSKRIVRDQMQSRNSSRV